MSRYKCFNMKKISMTICVVCIYLVYVHYKGPLANTELRVDVHVDVAEVKTTIPASILLKLKAIKDRRTTRAVHTVNRVYTTLSPHEQRMVNQVIAQRTTPTERTRANGAWVQFMEGVDIFGYSAFLDVRPSLGDHKRIVRIIAIRKVNPDNNRDRIPLCLFEDSSYIKASEQQIGMGVNLYNKHYKEFIFSCDLPAELKNVKFVSLIYPSDSKVYRSDKFIPIETPKYANLKKDLAICVSVTYWKQDLRRVVEWVELNRMMGVSHITIYNNTMDAASSRVFTAYMNSRNGLDENFLELRQSHRFLKSDLEINFHLHMSPVINDCLYRNMNSYRKIAVIDLDELIVPVKNESIYEMLLNIDRSMSTIHPARSFTFRNSYHFLNFKVTNDSPLTIISHEMAAPITQAGDSVKSIIDPQACVAMHNHYCWMFTPLFNDDNANIGVSPEFGMNQHYKNCHIDKYLNTKGECDKILSQGKAITSTKRYRLLLEGTVNKKIKELNLN